MQWIPTHDAAADALAAFLPKAGSAYARSRNYDHGPDSRQNVSCLSPWLRHRLVEEREVLAATLARHDRASAEKFVQEVFWRAYFKGWLEQRPWVWEHYCEELLALARRLAEERALRERHTRALAARTGIDCFDAWVHELRDTGYLHNHARMWFASIWIFTLQLPWQLGADFFYRHLLDADPASNTLSWRWVAGLHTRGKHYLARPDNIARYTGGRFHPRGQLDIDARPLCEEEADRGSPASLAMPDSAPRGAPFALLLTPEDCRPETLPLSHPPAALLRLTGLDGPVGEAGAQAPAQADETAWQAMPDPCGPRRGARGAEFADAATRDASARARRHFGLQDAPETAIDAAQPDWPATLLRIARDARLDTIVTAWAPVGPVATALAGAAPLLEREGVALLRVRRDYDSLAWPHATRGFFGLKKKIPAILEALAI